MSLSVGKISACQTYLPNFGANPPQPHNEKEMSTETKAVIGFGLAALAALGIYLLTKGKSQKSTQEILEQGAKQGTKGSPPLEEEAARLSKIKDYYAKLFDKLEAKAAKFEPGKEFPLANGGKRVDSDGISQYFNKKGRLTKEVQYTCGDASFYTRYDRSGRVIEEAQRNDLLGCWKYKYDKEGNKILKTSGLGAETHYKYDGKNMIEEKCGNTVWQYEYDNAGRQIKNSKILNGKVCSTHEITYNEKGFISTEVIKGSDGKTESLWENTYRDNGQLLTEKLTRGNEILEHKYKYNKKGRPTLQAIKYVDGKKVLDADNIYFHMWP